MRYLCSGNAPAPPPAAAMAGVVRGADSLVDASAARLRRHRRAARPSPTTVVPADQVAPLREGIGIFLRASSLTLVDMRQAEAEFARARAYAATLPEPSRTLMTHVNDRAVDKLGPLLLPVVDRLAAIGTGPATCRRSASTRRARRSSCCTAAKTTSSLRSRRSYLAASPARPRTGARAAQRSHHARRGRSLGRRGRRVGTDALLARPDAILEGTRGRGRPQRLDTSGSRLGIHCTCHLVPLPAAPSRRPPHADLRARDGRRPRPARPPAPAACAVPPRRARRGQRRHPRPRSACRPRPTNGRAPCACRSCCRRRASRHDAPPSRSSPKAGSRSTASSWTRSEPRPCPRSTTCASTTGG